MFTTNTGISQKPLYMLLQTPVWTSVILFHVSIPGGVLEGSFHSSPPKVIPPNKTAAYCHTNVVLYSLASLASSIIQIIQIIHTHTQTKAIIIITILIMVISIAILIVRLINFGVLQNVAELVTEVGTIKNF